MYEMTEISNTFDIKEGCKMNLEVPVKLNGESAREYAARVLRTNILSLNLKPGEIISENEIASLLNTSRTPIREAFIKLSQEHLIEIFPQKGTCVSKINLDYVEEGRFTRVTLEKALVRLICENYPDEVLINSLEENMHMQEFAVKNKNNSKLVQLDEEFHKALFKACKKERIHSVIESLNYDFYRLRMLTSTISINFVYSQHKEIVDAIKTKDASKAEKATEEHLTAIKLDQEVIKKQFPQYFI